MNAPSAFAAEIGRGEIDRLDQHGLTQHVAIFLADQRVLSDETFRLVKFDGEERISGPFEFHLELHARTDPGAPLDFAFDDLLTRPVTAAIDLPGAKPSDFARAIKGGTGQHLALWNGIVADFSMGVPGVYHLTMRPALWKLSLTNRYQIHRQLSIRGTIERVLGDHGITTDRGDSSRRNNTTLAALSGRDNPAVSRVQDWLQAGESDLDFIQRLMQKAHIFYYFEHHATHHCVVFANRPAYPDALAGGRPLRYAETGADPLGLDQDDLVLDYRYSQAMTSTGVAGVLTRQEAAWERDTVARLDTYRAQSGTQLGDLPFRRFQICQYGGSDGEVRWDTETCDVTRSTSAITLAGSSTCPGMHPGYCITLDHAGSPGNEPYPIRPTLAAHRFVLNQVQHKADLGGTYRNQFHATAATGQLAPFSMQNTQQGMVLAEVVKHDNGTDPKDWRYYQRSAFDPETDKLKDGSASPATLRPKGVYVRFATDPADAAPVWVKLAPHMLTAPELGVTVAVTRANDQSELPEIQSIVQSNGHKTVTPSGWTANTAVGSSYTTSYGDGRSVRFGLNSAGRLAPAKTWVDDKYNNGNSDVPGWLSGVHFREVSWSQGGSSSYSRAENGRDDVLSESWSVGSTYSQHNGKESKSISDIDASWSKQTIGSSDSYTTIDGKSYSWSQIGESESDNIIIGRSKSSAEIRGDSVSDHTVKGTSSSTQRFVGDSTSDTTFDGDSNSTTTIKGNSESHHTVNGSSTSYQTVNGTSTSHSSTGTAISLSKTGIQTHSGATGIANSNTVTGLSNNNSLTGKSMNISAGISATDIAMHAKQTSVSMTGVLTQISLWGTGAELKSKSGMAELETSGFSAKLVTALKIIL